LSLLATHPAYARDDIITLSTVPQPPPGYAYLPYANPTAPKGGAINISALGDFDNLNPFILRGTAPGSIFRVWQSLFKPSDTDTITAYAELASAVKITGNTVTFTLNPAARFSDGTKVTAQDVVWTFNTLVTQGSPIYAGIYAGVAKVEAPDDETVVFTVKPDSGRDLPLNLSEMYVLPQHFWKGRNFADPLLVPPIGSGPYVVSSVAYGNAVSYRRVKNWWAENLPADKGFYNFDSYTENYFQTDAVALQAFKAGQIDARVELSAKQWATGYDFPAVHDGQVKLELVPESLPAGIYGLVMNTRRPVFKDPRVRHALVLAFDFEWMNRVLFHNSYIREHSYFSSSPLASSGLPSPDELKLLAPFRGKIPDAVFTQPFTLPVTDGSGYNLPQLEAAMKLLNQAGWTVKNFKLVNAAGEQMHLEMLFDNQQFERIAISYAADLKLLGIDATVHIIDDATAMRRTNDYDYDMTMEIIPESDFPGAEQAGYWGCAAVNTPGGQNYAGVCDPAVDAMIQAEIIAPDAASKTAAIHALDRLLLNGWYFVPFWTTKNERLAYWQHRVAKPSAPLQIGFDYDLWWAK
jgi:microcin C transport system substrate-binding protein